MWSSRMLSKLKSFTAIRDMGSRTGVKKMYGYGDLHPSINGMYTLCLNTFCNMAIEVGNSTNINPEEELADLRSQYERWNKWHQFSEEDTIINKNQEDETNLHDKNASGAECVAGDSLNDGVDKISPTADHAYNIDCERMAYVFMKKYCKDWKNAFEFFQRTKLVNGLKHLPDSYNLVVDYLGESREFCLMWGIVYEMCELQGYVTLVTMAKVMRGLIRAGRYKETIEVFKRMEQFGVNKDVAALNMLLDALVKERSVELAQDVYLEFKNCIPPNFDTFDVLIHGWCNARNLEKAQLTFEEMREHGFSPDEVSYNSLIQLYCHKKDIRKVEDVLEEMQEKGCPPNAVTYAIVLQALGKARDINEALEVHKKMKHNGVVPDSSFRSSLIYILSEAGRIKDAHDNMPELGVTPNVWTEHYDTMQGISRGMIEHCFNYVEEGTALMLLKSLEENGCKLNNNTYNPLLKMYCRMKKIEGISFLLNHMGKNDVGVGIETFSILVEGLCMSGELEHACSFFEEIVSRGFLPWDSLYEMLVEKLYMKDMTKAKERIEALMLKARQQVLGCSWRRNSRHLVIRDFQVLKKEREEASLKKVLSSASRTPMQLQPVTTSLSIKVPRPRKRRMGTGRLTTP